MLSLKLVCVTIINSLLSLKPRKCKIFFQAGHVVSGREIHVLGHRGGRTNRGVRGSPLSTVLSVRSENNALEGFQISVNYRIM